MLGFLLVGIAFMAVYGIVKLIAHQYKKRKLAAGMRKQAEVWELLGRSLWHELLQGEQLIVSVSGWVKGRQGVMGVTTRRICLLTLAETESVRLEAVSGIRLLDGAGYSWVVVTGPGTNLSISVLPYDGEVLVRQANALIFSPVKPSEPTVLILHHGDKTHRDP